MIDLNLDRENVLEKQLTFLMNKAYFHSYFPHFHIYVQFLKNAFAFFRAFFPTPQKNIFGGYVDPVWDYALLPENSLAKFRVIRKPIVNCNTIRILIQQVQLGLTYVALLKESICFSSLMVWTFSWKVPLEPQKESESKL